MPLFRGLLVLSRRAYEVLPILSRTRIQIAAFNEKSKRGEISLLGFASGKNALGWVGDPVRVRGGSRGLQ
jgi:hypothetical protein